MLLCNFQLVGPDLGDSCHRHHYKNLQTHYHMELGSESGTKLVLMKLRGWYWWMVNCERRGAYGLKIRSRVNLHEGRM